MKKTAALLLAAMLALGILAGCSKEPAASGGDSSRPSSATSEASSQEAEETAKEYTPGIWVDDTRYESEFWGMAFTLPEGWLAATPEELGNVSDSGNELLSDEQRMQAVKAFEEGRSVTEMGVSDLYGTNIMMVVDNFTGVPGGSALTAEMYAGVVAEQLKAVPGIAYEVDEETVSKTIGGQEYVVLSAWVEEYGLTQWYAMRKEGSYMLSVICTFADGDGEALMEEALAGFSLLDAAA